MLRSTLVRLALPADKKAFMELVKTLRYRTEAPISDCSSALKEADGVLDTAMQILRKKGAARAMKKGDRVTEHGFVVSCLGSSPGSGAAVITMCSETDFAARNSHFQSTCVKVRDCLRDLLDRSEGRLLDVPEEATKALEQATEQDLRASIAVLGENIRIRSVTPLRVAPHVSEHVLIGTYTHGTLEVPDVGRIVGLAAVSQRSSDANVPSDVLTSIARHFVATSGAEGNYAHQNFFGTEETVGGWLRRHGLAFSSSLVMEFGKDPVMHQAPVIPGKK